MYDGSLWFRIIKRVQMAIVNGDDGRHWRQESTVETITTTEDQVYDRTVKSP